MTATVPERHDAKPLEFLRGFLRNPKAVGSVVPSSPVLVRRVLELGRVASARTVVELGPGTGPLTGEILDALPANGRLVAIERDERFLDHLRATLADPRLVLCHDSARRIETALRERGVTGGVDLVVSGIPFSTMEEAEARATLAAVRRVLAPAGRFVAYQFRDRVRELAEPVFGPGEIHGILRNIPPMRIFVWRVDGTT